MDDKDYNNSLETFHIEGVGDHQDGLHSDHHNHHHHHSHHHHSHRNNKRKKINISSRVGWTISVVLFVAFIVMIVLFQINKTSIPEPETPSNDPNCDALIVKVNNEEGVLVKEAVENFLSLDILNDANSQTLPSSFSNGEGRLDAQNPVSLSISLEEGEALLYKVELCDNDSFINASIDYLEPSFDTYEFQHLYASTTYYWRLTAYTSAGTQTATGQFKTANTPRILSIDGLSNVRDIGNWKTDSGKKIKQGLLIRGTDMDGTVESQYLLTAKGLSDMREIFGIKTDMDLRAQTAVSQDALGAGVKHKYYDMIEYDGIFTEAGKEKIGAIFADLADPDNYPIYLHCTYGLDRTGTVCYLLEALLGVSRGDCLRDYALSNKKYIANIQVVERGLEFYEGTTLKEQTESYLLSCGVNEYQINSIRKIFLGE